MIKYFCNLCGDECGEKQFLIPIAATWVQAEPYDLMPVEMHLCRACRTKIYKTAATIIPKDELEVLHAYARERKMGRI